MKKLALIFIFSFLFMVLTAEEAASGKAEDASENCVESAKTAKNVSNREEKPKKFYFMPVLGTNLGIWGPYVTVNIDADFLVSHNSQADFYLGLNLDFRYSRHSWFNLSSSVENDFEFPLQVNFVADWKSGHRFVRYISFWASFGVNLTFERDYIEIIEWHGDWGTTLDEYWEYSKLQTRFACGTGINIILNQNLVFKTGIELHHRSSKELYRKRNEAETNYPVFWPSLLVAFGYRF